MGPWAAGAEPSVSGSSRPGTGVGGVGRGSPVTPGSGSTAGRAASARGDAEPLGGPPPGKELDRPAPPRDTPSSEESRGPAEAGADVAGGMVEHGEGGAGVRSARSRPVGRGSSSPGVTGVRPRASISAKMEGSSPPTIPESSPLAPEATLTSGIAGGTGGKGTGGAPSGASAGRDCGGGMVVPSGAATSSLAVIGRWGIPVGMAEGSVPAAPFLVLRGASTAEGTS